MTTLAAAPPVITDAARLATRLLRAIPDTSDNVTVSLGMHRIHFHITARALDADHHVHDIALPLRVQQLRALAVAIGSTIGGSPLRHQIGDVWGMRVAGRVVDGLQVTVQADLTFTEAHVLGVLDDFDEHVASALAALIAPGMPGVSA